MNNKGFTLIELLATLVVFAIVVGICVGAVNFNFGKAKEKTEEVFVDTLRDAVDMYLSSEFGNLNVTSDCVYEINKRYKSDVKVFRVTKGGASIKFSNVINSNYKPLTESEFVNPANEEYGICNLNAVINVYRDEDYVYYYSINKTGLGCLKNTGGEYSPVITNLPEVNSCS